ncbi:transglutaminase-like cysteine peptidase [Roseibium denhamense]|uniref:Transglutaminase-like cysteine proteinase BTLCP n=1 Tax=Roseibium denhamense TaxID=76305 RepID=A0ABY1NDA3_9HYPH|nr:transglutaminase-like cysteine peptidase [Roseibium denhamense]SMP06960.1 transglutaminase-like cysteine proteinase BTLCP [Roseibium denhamense]
MQVLARTEQPGISLPKPSLDNLSRKWHALSLQIEHDVRLLSACNGTSCLSPSGQRFSAAIAKLKLQPKMERALLVKRLVDRRIAYRPDSEGQDTWSAPLETLERGYGDCEDITFATYTLLLQAGFDAQAMTLHLLQNRRTGLGHAVIVLQMADGTTLVFDNTKRRLTASVDPGYRTVASIRNGVFQPASGLIVANRSLPPRL